MPKHSQKNRRKINEFLCSKRTLELPKTVFPELMTMATQVKKIISLGPGEPDFTTPKHIIQFAKKKLDEGCTHYSSPGGKPELKEAIAKKLKKENRIKADPDENIIVTCGSTEALLLANMAVLDVTEEIMVPNPGFLAYKPMIELVNADPVDINLSEEDGFQVNPDEIKKKITKKTKAIILNTPGNPTGTVLKKNLLEEIADIAIENNLIVYSDEAYEKIVFGKSKHVSIGSFNGMQDNVITFHSFSKTFAMAGFRLGYAVGPKNIIETMEHIHVYTALTAPTISQLTGSYALNSKKAEKDTERMRKQYEKRNSLITKRIDEIEGLHLEVHPKGAFYAFPRFDFKMNSIDFAMWLIKHANVIAIPGTEFGTNGEGFIRMSYATDLALIEKAMNQIEKALKKLA